MTGIPKSPLSYVHVVREDPVRRGLLYAGTEYGVYVSFNDGEHWQPLQNNLPSAPVYWIVVQEHFSDLVIATYGRGFWILDDITALRELRPDVAAKDAHFSRPARRAGIAGWRRCGRPPGTYTVKLEWCARSWPRSRHR